MAPRRLRAGRAITMAGVVSALLALALAGCTTSPMPEPRRTMNPPIAAAEVVAFLHEFERLAEKEDFALLRDLIDERAFFRFNDGDFVGRAAIEAVFEKTWRGDPSVKKARFYLTDITVLTVDTNTASATYTYNWEGSRGERQFTIRGRGSRVLVRPSAAGGGAGFRIVHEHLSRFPPPPPPR